MIKAFIITLTRIPKSVESAQLARESAVQAGLEVEIFDAVSRENSRGLMEELGLEVRQCGDATGDFEAMLGCFLSHYSLWKKCCELNEPIVVLEHDAVVTGPIASGTLGGHSLVNLGKPHYGRLKKPKSLEFWVGYLLRFFRTSDPSVYSLFSRTHMPGTHGYYVEPKGAEKLVEVAHQQGLRPADLFMVKRDFAFMEEIYPWCVEARPKFSSIQTNRSTIIRSDQKDHFAEEGEFLTAADIWEK